MDHAAQDTRDSYKFSPATLRAPASELPADRAGRAASEMTGRTELEHAAPSRAGYSGKLAGLVTRLEHSIGAGSFDRYFSRDVRLELSDEALEVTVKSEFVADLLDRRFGAQLRAASEDRALPVRYRVERDGFAAPPPTPGQTPTRAVQPVPTSHPRTPQHEHRPRRAGSPGCTLRHSFDDFIVGASNRLAYAASVRVAEEKGTRSFSPLFIHGTCGLGKTHLLQGLAKRFAQLNPGAVVRYTTAETFTNEFITAMKAGQVEPFRRSLRRLDLLCVDDIHFLANKEATQAELLHTFDALDHDGARLVLASDEHPREIRKLSEQLTSRFLAGAVVKIESPDPETRLKLVKHIAARRGLVLDDGAARLLAERSGRSIGALGGFGGSVREIEGLITQVEAVHRLLPEFASTDGVIGLVLVRKALGLNDAGASSGNSDGVPQIRRPIHAEQVLNEVCKALRVDIAELMGRGRHPRVVLARSITAHLSRRLTTMSYPEIARAMNRPNHSTIITACKRLAGAMERAERPSPTLELGAEMTGMTITDLCEHLSARVQRVAGA